MQEIDQHVDVEHLCALSILCPLICVFLSVSVSVFLSLSLSLSFFLSLSLSLSFSLSPLFSLVCFGSASVGVEFCCSDGAADREVRTMMCIFKVGDDVRQDVIALQVSVRSDKARVHRAMHQSIFSLLFPLHRVVASCRWQRSVLSTLDELCLCCELRWCTADPQVMQIIKDICKDVGIPSLLFPYRWATHPEFALLIMVLFYVAKLAEW